MYLILMNAALIIVIMFTVILLIPIINKHKNHDREKMSPFECGFDPFSNSRISFSIHFFSIMLMFLIFDIEITILLPIPILKLMVTNNSWVMMISFMSLILILGLILEWKEGSMNWK
uniref:NADH-ubiquinone oxidoreductase chain 3 n=1 Tax=Euphyllura phillyreae TaxID=2008460 RepID=A0A344A2B1_9HEMI|nr:NADH dehydrogenase subunit 3 [Euphyllura phillyreae]AWU48902.1 NADH dehydrogenase subunit 3 [Euphyllura phillyreae]